MAWSTGRRDIQGRALKANPKLADMFSEESTRGRARGAEQYRKRGQS